MYICILSIRYCEQFRYRRFDVIAVTINRISRSFGMFLRRRDRITIHARTANLGGEQWPITWACGLRGAFMGRVYASCSPAGKQKSVGGRTISGCRNYWIRGGCAKFDSSHRTLSLEWLGTNSPREFFELTNTMNNRPAR